MRFDEKLIEATLVRRYKRFLADALLPDGSVVTVHTANTGAMSGCAEPGSRIWLSHSGNPRRTYPLTWELVEVRPGVLAGVNPARANRLAEEAIAGSLVEELQGYDNIRREVSLGASRIDLLLEQKRPETAGPRSASVAIPCYVEVKSVTLVEDGIALFPDAISGRGARQLEELAAAVGSTGIRGVVFFCVQRGDARQLRPAARIDPKFATALRAAASAGVEPLAYVANVTTSEISLVAPVPVIL